MERQKRTHKKGGDRMNGSRNDEKIHVFLTRSQIANLVEFFEMAFIPYVRDDTEIDNMGYLVDMSDAYRTLKDSLGS